MNFSAIQNTLLGSLPRLIIAAIAGHLAWAGVTGDQIASFASTSSQIVVAIVMALLSLGWSHWENSAVGQKVGSFLNNGSKNAVLLLYFLVPLFLAGCSATTTTQPSAPDLGAVVTAQVALATAELAVEDLYATQKIGPKTYTDLRAIELQASNALDQAAEAAKAGQPLTQEQQLAIAQGFISAINQAILGNSAATQPATLP